jgi:hypothetical protein
VEQASARFSTFHNLVLVPAYKCKIALADAVFTVGRERDGRAYVLLAWVLEVYVKKNNMAFNNADVGSP